MTYHSFAQVYDILMKDAPYEEWLQLIANCTEQHRLEGKRVLDVGCGTGEMAICLAKQGFQVTGVDLSEEMLTMAQQKCEANRLRISFYQQDMRALEGLGQYDVILILCDSLNYLQSLADVEETFKGIARHLQQNGIVIFDVHSLKKMETSFHNQTYADNLDDVSYIWHTYAGETPNCVEHELTFFVQEKNQLTYRRFDEVHVQQTFSIEQYKETLEKAGLQALEVSGDFGKSNLDTAERLIFICKKIAN